jgi:hypothetical protein
MLTKETKFNEKKEQKNRDTFFYWNFKLNDENRPFSDISTWRKQLLFLVLNGSEIFFFRKTRETHKNQRKKFSFFSKTIEQKQEKAEERKIPAK